MAVRWPEKHHSPWLLEKAASQVAPNAQLYRTVIFCVRHLTLSKSKVKYDYVWANQ